MPSTRRQKAKARRSRETDLLSDIDKMDVVLGDECSKPFERELANTINGSIGHNYTDVLSNSRGNSSQENKITDFNVENDIPRHDRFTESWSKHGAFSRIGFLDVHDAISDQQGH